jgi:REP-associated tyrosine transposase
MPHPYPAHCPTFDYIGKHRYFLTFPTFERQPRFADAAAVALVLSHILRAAAALGFEAFAYCFMPDHLHLVVNGLRDNSDLKAFEKAAKQYAGYYYKQSWRMQLWQRYGHDRIIRDDPEFIDCVRYVVENPVKAGLVADARSYPFSGSGRWSLDELVDWCRKPGPLED